MSNKAVEKLLALATEAERAAASYRLAAAALNGHAVDKRVARSAAVLGDALELDAARREKQPKGKPKKRTHTGEHTREKLATREGTARVLKILADKGPMTAAALREAAGRDKFPFGSFIHNGFVKAVGDKYKRTAKPFVVDWRA